MSSIEDIATDKSVETLPVSIRKIVANSKRSITIIAVMVLASLIIVSVILYLFSNLQKLSELSNKQIELWRDVGHLSDYLLSGSDDHPITEKTLESIQTKLKASLEEDQSIENSYNELLQDSSLTWSLFVAAEKDEIVAVSGIDKNLRDKISELSRAPQSAINAGFSAWDTAMAVNLKSERFLRDLNSRSNALFDFQNRVVALIGWVFLFVIIVNLGGVYLIWKRILNPTLNNLRQSYAKSQEQALLKARMQHRIADQERELRLVLDNISGSVFSFDKNLKYTSANKSYLKTYNMKTEAEIVGKDISDVIGVENWKRIEPRIENAIKGESIEFDLELETSSGPRITNIIVVPGDFSGGSDERFFALAIDVHERRVAEEALKTSEENLRTTLQSIGDAVIVTDKDGKVTRINDVASQLTGWPIEEALDKSLEDVFAVVDVHSSTAVRQCFDKILQGKFIAETGGNFLLRSRDGKEYEIAASDALIQDHTHETRGVVVVFRDVTEEKSIQTKLARHDKMKSIGSLAGGIAHDFNNMLAGITNASDSILLLERGNISEKSQNYLKSIIRTTERAADLTKKLMAFARVGSYEFDYIDFHSIINDTIELLDKTSNRSISKNLNINAERYLVHGNPGALQSVILNICINAIQAMPGSGVLSLTTDNVLIDEKDCKDSVFDLEPGEHIQIRIEDTGEGIQKDNLPKIFEPFFTTKQQGQGTGLGLSAVYGTIFDHRGSITVESKMGSGTEFTILLPCADVTETRPSVPVKTKLSKGNGTILLVDDEELLLETSETMLESLGYNTITSNNGSKALEIYKTQQDDIDLILLDMNMPEKSGLETLKDLRKIDPKCKVIIVTGFAVNEDLAEVKKEGISEIFHKPYKLNELSMVISKYIDSHGPNPAGETVH